ncbi:MAG TPA: Ppx/GppA family phosphatase [Spirochaetia bacterium]|nr:Ppx/GppA family phosphatase [Spirochaetia bacterium]
MVRIAGIDIGSNSVRLLVAEVEGDRVVELATRRVTTRLGEGINQGVLQEHAVARTMEALDTLLADARSLRPDAVVAVATSAVRDARNGAGFVQAAHRTLGLDVRVLDGDEEARLAWRGVQAGLDLAGANIVVMDVGGGSTEFTWGGEPGGQAVSVRAGAVRLTEAGLGRVEVAALLAPVLGRIRPSRPDGMVGVGGTITTACAMKMGLKGYERGRLHGQELGRADVGYLVTRVAASTQQERLRLPGLDPERADIILAGLTIVAEVLDGLGLDGLVVSETGLLHGLVWTTASQIPDGVVGTPERGCR